MRAVYLRGVPPSATSGAHLSMAETAPLPFSLKANHPVITCCDVIRVTADCVPSTGVSQRRRWSLGGQIRVGVISRFSGCEAACAGVMGWRDLFRLLQLDSL
jgi:hypothetical protein